MKNTSWIQIAAGAVFLVVAIVGISLLTNKKTPPANSGSSPTVSNANQASSTNIKQAELWKTQNGDWFATSTPPPCTEPIEFASPTDVSKVTAILYPGQPRGDAWKPHGGFRFSDTTKEGNP